MRRTVHTILVVLLMSACSVPGGDFVEYDCAPDAGAPDGAMPIMSDGAVLSCAPQLAHSGVGPDGTWESAPWAEPDAPWIPYPPRVTITVEHNLGYVPTSVYVNLAFNAAGTGPVLAAGDLALINRVDATTIVIHNGTNGDYFARVTAR